MEKTKESASRVVKGLKESSGGARGVLHIEIGILDGVHRIFIVLLHTELCPQYV